MYLCRLLPAVRSLRIGAVPLAGANTVAAGRGIDGIGRLCCSRRLLSSTPSNGNSAATKKGKKQKHAPHPLEALIVEGFRGKDFGTAVRGWHAYLSSTDQASVARPLSPSIIGRFLHMAETWIEQERAGESSAAAEAAIGTVLDTLRNSPTSKDLLVGDKKIQTMLLRLEARLGCCTPAALLQKLGLLADEGALTRRCVTPVLEACRRAGDSATADAAVKLYRQRGNDVTQTHLMLEDYQHLLALVQNRGGDTAASGSTAEKHDATNRIARLDRLLDDISTAFPVVDVATAASVQSSAEALGCAAHTVEHVPRSSDVVCCPAPNCGQPLRGFPFTPEFRENLLRTLLDLIRAEGERKAPGLGDRHQAAVKDLQKRKLEEYRNRCLKGKSRVALVDAANIGYYGVSKWYAEIKRQLMRQQGKTPKPEDVDFRVVKKRGFVDVPIVYDIIDLAVTQLIKDGFLPLVLLHERHLSRRTLAVGRNQQIYNKWLRQQIVFGSPTGMNDDYLWMYAAIFMTPGVDEATGVSAATLPSVVGVSNDLMRDHHFALLSRSAFLRWRDRHKAHFKCERVNDETRIVLQYPNSYSNSIQRKAGDVEVATPAGITTRIGGWHVPFTSRRLKMQQDTGRAGDQLERSPAGTQSEGRIQDDEEDPADNIQWLCVSLPSPTTS